MEMIKRLIFIMGFIPVIFLLCLWWVVTGKDINKRLDKYINWGISG